MIQSLRHSAPQRSSPASSVDESPACKNPKNNKDVIEYSPVDCILMVLAGLSPGNDTDARESVEGNEPNELDGISLDLWDSRPWRSRRCLWDTRTSKSVMKYPMQLSRKG
ncbi:60s acidic ribosomal protein [Moniliophthora roreri]|nr:60s acidic ribosomal protein [Moniliophthora roreri]